MATSLAPTAEARSRPEPTGSSAADEARRSTRIARSFPAALTTVVAIAFLVYWASPVRLETDSFWTTYTARSLVAHGDVNIDEYHAIYDRSGNFQVETIDGHHYYEVPLAASLTSVPVVAIASIVDGPGLDRRLASGHAQPLDGIVAAIIAALAVGVVFAVIRRITPRRGIALAVTGVFAFGTQAWSTASRTTWMHGPSMLCLIIALYCALRVRESAHSSGPWRGGWFVALGASLAFAYFVRPTNVVPLVVFAVWAAGYGRRLLARYAVGAAGVTVVMLTLDWALYGRLVQPYFRAGRLGLSTVTFEALVGNLVSPSRGLLVFVPATLLCGYGAWLRRRSGGWTTLDTAVGATVVGSWILVSLFPHWWAGYAYGPRFLTDIAPLLVWFLPPALARAFSAAAAARRSAVFPVVALLLVSASVATQARGALAQSTVAWNWTPADVTAHPERVWDWSDPQFLR
jgi:hypothetical protein